MKRAAIITITDYLNYGNRLQNFATQEVLKKYGLEVESIPNFPEREKVNEFEFTTMRIKNALKLSPVVLLTKIAEKLRNRINKEKFEEAKKAKEISFRKYAQKHSQESNFEVRNNIYPDNLSELYDYFVIGSDQIWNPHIRYGNNFDFATFASAEKRIALAPSFGVSNIEDKYKERYTNWISEIPFLSVREDAGAELIKKLTGREAPVLIDPTLMLNKNQWLAVSEVNKKKPNKPYLLTYFIGDVSKKRKKVLKYLSLKYKLELVQLASLDDIERFDANPGEFIDYINSSALVCTDSFHAIIFSIHMQKPFVVFDREGKSSPMSSRIETLLLKFGFQNRKYSELFRNNNYFDIDFKHVIELLEFERKKVNEFLEKSLQLKIE